MNGRAGHTRTKGIECLLDFSGGHVTSLKQWSCRHWGFLEWIDERWPGLWIRAGLGLATEGFGTSAAEGLAEGFGDGDLVDCVVFNVQVLMTRTQMMKKCLWES